MGVERKHPYPIHGWVGIALALIFWAVNWSLEGLRTHWAFFPMWLGYCLAVDGLVYKRRATSLLTRSWRKYTGLFLLSAPVWWLFEVFNWHLQNWRYAGSEQFTPFQFWLWASINFTTVIPAVFGSAELASTFPWVQRLGRGLRIGTDLRTTMVFFLLGWLMLTALLFWPHWFFPLVWISIYFIMEPLNIWLGHRSLADWTKNGDWRPVIALWIGILITAFFWEMWNFFSYPKWLYSIPWGDFQRIFEMPVLGYGGYLPFALELTASYHLVVGLLKIKAENYLQLT